MSSLGAQVILLVLSCGGSILAFPNKGYERAYGGDAVTREVDDNTRMSIESSKPVLVSLILDGTLDGTNGDWGSMVTIPATDQYTTQHTFPAMAGFQFLDSVAVSKVSNYAEMSK